MFSFLQRKKDVNLDPPKFGRRLYSDTSQTLISIVSYTPPSVVLVLMFLWHYYGKVGDLDQYGLRWSEGTI